MLKKQYLTLSLFDILMMKEGTEMGLKDLLGKGVDMINKGVASAKNAAEEKKKAMQEFDILKTRSTHIGPTLPYEIKNPSPQTGKEQMILNACLTISVENSKLVNQLLPVDETVIDVKTSKEAQTEIEYVMVITDRKLWVLNKNEYVTYEFESIKNFEIVNKGLMSHGIKFNDNAFIVDGKETDIKLFGDILLNPEYRKEAIARVTKYLCGVVPKKQVINMKFKGMTLGQNGELVLHNAPENKSVRLSDITGVALLINDTVCLMRGLNDSGSITASPMEARKMSVKIIFTMGEYVIETLPQSMMNTTYKREETTYRTNYEFSKELVETIAEIMKGNTFDEKQEVPDEVFTL